MVMSCLINTMGLEIVQSFIFCSTAKEIWDGINATYFAAENMSELFQIKGDLRNLQQGGLIVTQL